MEERSHITATLRQAREGRQLTIEGAAAEAGIPLRYAKLLEGQVPSGVGISDELYLIPFFRRYANALGLSAEELLPEFLGQVQDLPAPSAAPLSMRRRARRRTPWRALAAVTAVGVASVIIMRQAPERPSLDDERWAEAEQASRPTSARVEPLASAPSERSDAADAGEQAPRAEMQQAPSMAPEARKLDPPAANAASGAPIPSDASIAAVAAPPAAVAAPPAEASGASETAAAPDNAHELRVTATQETWFALGIDDERKRNIYMHPGETRSWTAAHAFSLTVGNAGGITVSFDGRELPPLGRPGQVVRNVRLPEEPPPANG